MKAKIGMKVKILDKNTWYEYKLTDEEINILKSIDEFEDVATHSRDFSHELVAQL